MKPNLCRALWLSVFLLHAALSPFPLSALTNDLSGLLQQGLFEEEANRNLPAAIEAYEALTEVWDHDRAMAATAVFRLGECYRKLGRTNEAATAYQRILDEFSDQTTLATLSRQNLRGMGFTSVPSAARVVSNAQALAVRAEQRRLLEEERDLVRQELVRQEQLFSAGQLSSSDLVDTKRELLGIEQRLVELSDPRTAISPPVLDAPDQAGELATQLAAIEALKSEPTDQARAVQALFPDEDLKAMLLRLSRLEAQERRLQQESTNTVVRVFATRDGRDGLDLLDVGGAESPRGLEAARGETRTQLGYIAERVEFILGIQRARLKALSSVGPTSSMGDETRALLERIDALPPEQLRQVMPTLVPDELLISLLQEHQALEAQRVGLAGTLTEDHPSLRAVDAQLEQLDRKIEERIDGIRTGLELKAAAARPARRTAGPEGSASMTIDEEEQEIRRLRAMLKNSPDLINVATGEDQLSPLCRAARNGQLRVAQFLLQNGAGVDTSNGGRGKVWSSWVPLLFAVEAGHKAMVELLLSEGANPDARTGRTQGNKSALHLAVSKGFNAVAEALVEGGADVNRGDRGDITPLFSAISGDQPGLVEFLLEQGADARVSTSEGYTPLMQAATGHGKTLDLLIRRGANIEQQTDGGRVALSYAAEYGDLEAVRTLLSAGADPDGGKTHHALHMASMNGHQEVVAALLVAGADPNLESVVLRTNPMDARGSVETRSTALGFAVESGYEPVVRLLVAHGANPDDRIPSGYPVVMKAALGNSAILEALLEAGANPDVQDDNRDEALAMAARRGYSESVKLLLRHGANPDGLGGGWPPLHAALAEQQLEASEALVKGGANLELPFSNDATTPLITAISHQTLDGVELLLQAGADVNRPNAEGLTPLHLATQARDSEIISLLLSHGADVNARDVQGRTPLDLTESSRSKEQTIARATLGGALRQPGLRPPGLVYRQVASVSEVAEILRKHGALGDLPDFDSIRLTRPGWEEPRIVFIRNTNDWNSFSLLDALSIGYRSSSETHGFPDLARIVIHRPVGELGAESQGVRVNLLDETNGIACDHDVSVRFGDVIEIPVREHALSDTSDGLSQAERQSLDACVMRTVQLVVRDQFRELTPYPSYLGWVMKMDEAKSLLLSSSDLSRVSVARQDPTSGRTISFIVDLTLPPDPRADLWLRDGDVITVPDKE